MAKLRKGSCYRKITRAYTRKSKFKKKDFIKAVPKPKIVRYSSGDISKKYDYEINLVSKDAIQIRHNAIESARLVVSRKLNKKLGNLNYYFRVMIYPHQILRENRMLTGAGADRMQTGMQKAFGKVMGIAAQVKKDQPIFTAYVNKENLEITKNALKLAPPRLPCRCSIKIKELS